MWDAHACHLGGDDYGHFQVRQELREFWGNKSSKGFAGPGLTGSRLGLAPFPESCRVLLDLMGGKHFFGKLRSRCMGA